MNRSDLDWHYIRRHTLRPSICLLVAALTLGFAVWTHGKHEQLFLELNANHEAVHEDYAALVKQRKIVDRYHRRYQRFGELGFIGRESRLDWVETLRITSESLGIPRLSYSIEPQTGVVAPVSSILGGENIQIRVSRMQLEMGLVHEIDLLRFFDALQQQAPGLIKVDQCDLAFLGDANVSIGEHNLSANCAVQIFSVITSDVDGDSA
ncbi:MAG: hypothetical protein K0U72_14345 [Gammaproteobacteria bacterium]|nr:hypothetical protein [Gammaproteobacteria bacterium]